MTPREIDALVAEKVMGRQVEKAAANGELLELIGNVWMSVAKYSTDIAAAWSVVEKLQEKFVTEIYDTQLTKKESFGYIWGCVFRAKDHTFKAMADTAPMAIALAALKAVGVEVDDE